MGYPSGTWIDPWTYLHQAHTTSTEAGVQFLHENLPLECASRIIPLFRNVSPHIKGKDLDRDLDQDPLAPVRILIVGFDRADRRWQEDYKKSRFSARIFSPASAFSISIIIQRLSLPAIMSHLHPLSSPSSGVAFVAGANGITGHAIVEYLIARPETEW